MIPASAMRSGADGCYLIDKNFIRSAHFGTKESLEILYSKVSIFDLDSFQMTVFVFAQIRSAVYSMRHRVYLSEELMASLAHSEGAGFIRWLDMILLATMPVPGGQPPS